METKEDDNEWYLCHCFDKDDEWFELNRLKYIKDEMSDEEHVDYTHINLDYCSLTPCDIRKLKKKCIFDDDRYFDVFDRCKKYFESRSLQQIFHC